MNLRQAYLGMIKAFPGGWDAISAALGMSCIALENRIYERKGQDLHVQTALQLQEFSQTTQFADAIAAQSGGTFVKLPCVDHINNESISDKFHEIFEEFGELSVEFRSSTKDGVINPRERESMNALVDKIHKTMDELRAMTFKVYCPETKAASVAKLGGAE